MSDAPHAITPITYLTTHFPAVSHTFIATEIDALEREGLRVVPVALNAASSDAIAQPGNRRWIQRTFCLKSAPRWKVARVVAASVLRHPSVLLVPIRQGGHDLKAHVWRILQMFEALVLLDHMRQHGSRHVHAHFGQAPATVAWFTAEAGRRCHPEEGPWTWSVTIHGWHEFVNERAALLREKVAGASLVVAVSDFTRSQLARISGAADWSHIHVVRCGIDLEHFPARPPRPIGAPPHVVMTARVSPEKGHLILIDAIARLAADGLEIIVDIVGPDEGGFASAVRARSEQLGLSESVHFHGPASPSEVAELVGAADVFCLPTFAEGLPIVLMEAMALGVPVLTTYVSGIPELAVDGVTALVVPAARADLLADGLRRLLGDAALCDALAAGGARAVRERHDIERTGPQLAALLRPLLRRAP